MKKFLFISALILIAASCISKSKHEEQLAKLAASQDSINAVVMNREAEISNFLADFTEIQLNLDSIKQIEKMMTLKSNNSELKLSAKNQIISDFKRLQQLNEQNKKLVRDLKWLRSKDLKKNKEFAQTIALLEKQLIAKDGEISELNNKIAALNIDVSDLKSNVDLLTAESQRKTQELLDKETKMNQAWYVLGTDKALIADTLIEKTGGFLGLGRTLRVTKDLNEDAFEMVDLRTFRTVELNVKKAKLISVHPEGSYHFDGDDNVVATLQIDDAYKFWSLSKHLVISID